MKALKFRRWIVPALMVAIGTTAAYATAESDPAIATLPPADLATFRAFAAKSTMKTISSINETAHEIRIQYQDQMTSLIVVSGLSKWTVQ